MEKKTKTLYTIARKWQDKIFVIKDVIVKYDDQADTDIDEQIKSIENGYGRGCVWNDTYLSMDMCDEHNITYNERYGFEEHLKIRMGINSEVDILLDKPGEMSTSSIMHVFREIAFDLLIPVNETPNHDELIEAEYAEIMNLMKSRRQLKKLMFSCESTDSYVYKIAKECSIMHKKLIKELLERYDRKCGIDEQENQK